MNDLETVLTSISEIRDEMTTIFHENWGANDIDMSLSNMKESDAPVTFYELRQWIRGINRAVSILGKYNEPG